MATAKKATISAKGQFAIPKSVRERMNLKPGMKVSIEVQGGVAYHETPGFGTPGLAHDARHGQGEDRLTDVLMKERAAS